MFIQLRSVTLQSFRGPLHIPMHHGIRIPRAPNTCEKVFGVGLECPNTFLVWGDAVPCPQALRLLLQQRCLLPMVPREPAQAVQEPRTEWAAGQELRLYF